MASRAHPGARVSEPEQGRIHRDPLGVLRQASKDKSFHRQAIEISETGGKWGKAVEVPGSGKLNAGGGAGVTAVSCASARSCLAAGTYRDGSRSIQGFVATHS